MKTISKPSTNMAHKVKNGCSQLKGTRLVVLRLGLPDFRVPGMGLPKQGYLDQAYVDNSGCTKKGI